MKGFVGSSSWACTSISYAAFRALVDVLPVDTNCVYIPLMKQLGYDPNDNSTDIETPTGIGNIWTLVFLLTRICDVYTLVLWIPNWS